jgi:peptidyl-prolyl cis-trans isomerase A (cyclophilin A)
MGKIKQVLAYSILFVFVAMGALLAQEQKKDEELKEVEVGLYATFQTSMGNITCRLFEKETPSTVDNFVALATGKKEWLDPKTGKKVKKKFYDGLTFHRVIPKFMIQGGCPLGTGTGGPGYKFGDEIVPEIVFDRPGLLAMANAGPGTNGSQFFITHIPTPWLNGNHTIFGEVVSGMDVVHAIGNVDRGPGDKPVKAVIIKKINIKRVE